MGVAQDTMIRPLDEFRPLDRGRKRPLIAAVADSLFAYVDEPRPLDAAIGDGVLGRSENLPRKPSRGGAAVARSSSLMIATLCDEFGVG